MRFMHLENSHKSPRFDLQSVTRERDGNRGKLEPLQARFIAEARKTAAALSARAEANRWFGKWRGPGVPAVETAKKEDEEVVRREQSRAPARYTKKGGVWPRWRGPDRKTGARMWLS